MSSPKHSIVTFKADASLIDALRAVPNRSSFIRSAVLAALDNMCPLCQGSGILNPQQRNHWAEFSADHKVEECDDCHEWHLVCAHDPAANEHRPRRARRRSRRGDSS
ncbi:MAG: CopG family transcriptional regulator [Phycisphaerae bacterium]|nr:CopG family transcriptional regulator [Phycisphaerae bacterium]